MQIVIALDEKDFSFITKFDPDRDRIANRAQLADVLEEIQDLIEDAPRLVIP